MVHDRVGVGVGVRALRILRILRIYKMRNMSAPKTKRTHDLRQLILSSENFENSEKELRKLRLRFCSSLDLSSLLEKTRERKDVVPSNNSKRKFTVIFTFHSALLTSSSILLTLWPNQPCLVTLYHRNTLIC